MTFSQNGYRANQPELTTPYVIPGTKRTVRLRRGDAGALLVDFAAWFHTHIEPIDVGQLDDWGYAERNVRGSTTVVSNHASGTAIDLNATRHPMGERGTFSHAQTAAIRDRLKVYDGCIRWGGDYTGRPDEMHFEINKPLAEVSVVARALRSAPPAPKPSPNIDAAIAATRKAIAARKPGRIRRALRTALAALRLAKKG